jgi:hypothetical protein
MGVCGRIDASSKVRSRASRFVKLLIDTLRGTTDRPSRPRFKSRELRRRRCARTSVAVWKVKPPIRGTDVPRRHTET